MTIAVEDSTKPMPATKATSGAIAGEHAGDGQQRAADEHLRGAQPEDLAPQAPQPRRLHFQADHEQEHDDAELGDMQDRLRIGEQAEPERADDQPRGQIAEHRAEAEPLEDRHRDDAGRQQRHHLDEIVSGRFRHHVMVLAIPVFGIARTMRSGSAKRNLRGGVGGSGRWRGELSTRFGRTCMTSSRS